VSRFGTFKQWPAEHYRALCRRLEREHDARLLITWGPGEEELARSIAQGSGRTTVAPPTPRLKQLAALVAASDLVVAGDTGCLHLAAALGTPIVGLYGPKNAQLYGPFPRRGRVLQSQVPCSPCKLRRCEHRVCMSEIRPAAVAAAAAAALAERRLAAGVA
jgi:ADP-heptose:LPS heptosyltransferase